MDVLHPFILLYHQISIDLNRTFEDCCLYCVDDHHHFELGDHLITAHNMMQSFLGSGH